MGCRVGGVPVASAHFWDRCTGTDAVSSRIKLCQTRIILCVRKILKCTVLLAVVMRLRKSEANTETIGNSSWWSTVLTVNAISATVLGLNETLAQNGIRGGRSGSVE